jgi:uncharacterized protein with von Willebrand factor type A (vWA) domain
LEAHRVVSSHSALAEADDPTDPIPLPPAGHQLTPAEESALALKDASQPHVRWPSASELSPSRAPHLNRRDGIVFILDISGSMYEPYAGSTRLALARQLLAQRIRALKPGTLFAIAVYGETALTSGPLVPANDATRQAAIRFLDQDYPCGGGTNLPAGLDAAENLGMGAIVLVTDGDLNMSKAELLPQVDRILGAPGQSPSLTVLAIGPRPNTDAREILRAVAAQQDGTYLVGEGGNDGLLTFNKPGPDAN